MSFACRDPTATGCGTKRECRCRSSSRPPGGAPGGFADVRGTLSGAALDRLPRPRAERRAALGGDQRVQRAADEGPGAGANPDRGRAPRQRHAADRGAEPRAGHGEAKDAGRLRGQGHGGRRPAQADRRRNRGAPALARPLSPDAEAGGPRGGAAGLLRRIQPFARDSPPRATSTSPSPSCLPAPPWRSTGSPRRRSATRRSTPRRRAWTCGSSASAATSS